MKYREFVVVAPRFTRAINIERDIRTPAAVDGYVLTTTAQIVLSRFARALREPAGHRAWTLTGPYGAGKSAFAVFAANLLGARQSKGTVFARQLLERESKALHRELFDGRRVGSLPAGGFCTIALSGSPEPLLQALLRACCRDIRNYYSHGRPPAALKKLEKLRDCAEKGSFVSAQEAIDCIIQIAEGLQRSGRSQGVFIVIDELGKFLEFAARNTDKGDIYLLQQLAESTARFKVPGLFLVTILHQSFERYVAGLRPALRDEWAKVQGRFEDIAYQEPAEDWLHLLASAIEHRDHPERSKVHQKARQEAEKAWELGLAPLGTTKAQFINFLQRCVPLHPVTVLLLAQLCRKFGQNQRSLFSFLVSREPASFAQFLDQDCSTGLPLYRPYHLYDYVVQAFGSALTVGESASRWAEVQSALERCNALPEPQLQLIKTVGLLTAIGIHGNLKPSPDVLQFAIGDARSARNCAEILASRSVLIYRKHSDSYGLWEGSDIDLDERVQEAGRQLPGRATLTSVLNSLSSHRPVVAKRHSIQTGTLRYFSVRFAEAPEILKALDPERDSDGQVVYVLPGSSAEIEEIVALATSPVIANKKDVLLAVPRDIGELKDAARQLELLEWVATNTPELHGDGIARRELQSRLAIARERLSMEIAALFTPGGPISASTSWFHCGARRQVNSFRSLSNLLSEICDAVYPHTPRLQNELLNRRNLSSAAAAARRNLVEAMIARGGEERLGISGAPPELSMYVSLLEATGMHRKEESGYAFGDPAPSSGLAETWDAISKFFASCELERKGLVQLFSLLQAPPFGLKMGVIPVLFCASALAHDTEIAIYENGSFAPELTVELFERLLRSPEKFEIRRYRIAGVRREVFNRLAGLLGATTEEKSEYLVPVIRPLFKFFNRLPAYTKQTKTLSNLASAVRDALFAAREPDLLIFEELPRACGVPPFGHSGENLDEVQVFFQSLKRAISELQRAYDDLLSDVQQTLFRAFGISGMKGREILRFRALAVAQHAVESRLRAFVHHLMDTDAEDVTWIEAVATFLVSKPPRNWSDPDRARYELAVSELTRTFRHIEAIVSEMSSRSDATKAPGEVLRIGVTDRFSKDLETVVIIEPEDQATVAEAVIAIEDVLERQRAGSLPTLSLAALAMVSRKFLSELEKPVKSQKASCEEVPSE